MYYKFTDKDVATNSIIRTEPIRSNVEDFIEYLGRFWEHYWNAFENVTINVHFCQSRIIIIAKNEEGWLWSKLEIYGLTPKTFQEIKEAIIKQKNSN